MVAFSSEVEDGRPAATAHVLAVCVSPGGIPKLPLAEGTLTTRGLLGDGRNHAKHVRPERAVSLWDCEILAQMVAEGFSTLVPGAAGENLTVAGLAVQSLTPGTLLRIGDAVLKLEQPRKPCYVLDAIDQRLKEAIVGRCGFLASVVREGTIRPGMPIEVVSAANGDSRPAEMPVVVERTASGEPTALRTYSLAAGPTIA